MASVSGRYATGSTGVGTSSNYSKPGNWSYAVPSGETQNPASASYAEPSANDYTTTAPQSNPSNQVYNTSRPTARRKDKPIKALDNNSTYTNNFKQPHPIHDQSDMSVGNSEPDSLLDLYEPKATSRDWPIKRKTSQSAVSSLSDTNEDPDKESKWIHREKLAEIESRELAQLGLTGRISKPKSSRLTSKKSSSVAASDDLDGGPQDTDLQGPDYKRIRTTSPTLSNDDYEQNGAVGSMPTSPNHTRKHSLSRIPVTRNSQQQADPGSTSQSTPPYQRLARSGLGSQSSQNASGIPKATSPLGSTTLPGTSQSPTSPTSADSTTRGIQTAKAPTTTPPSTVRKTSQTNGKAAPAATPTPPRPNTSGGSRPSTARPEGEAPWIASMYKPDPRLPPDQQMLPTHAKRLAQEKEMRELMEYQASQDPHQSEYILADDDDEAEDDDVENPQHQSSRNIQNSPRGVQQQQQHQPYYGHPQLQNQAGAPEREQQQYFHANDQQSPAQQGTYLNYQSNKWPTGGSPRINGSPRDDGEWPLRTPPGDKELIHPALRHPSNPGPANQSPVRTGTPVLDSSYSLIPAIQEQTLRDSYRSNQAQSAPQVYGNRSMQVTRVPNGPEPDEKAQDKGSCRCCIVM